MLPLTTKLKIDMRHAFRWPIKKRLLWRHHANEQVEKNRDEAKSEANSSFYVRSDSTIQLEVTRFEILSTLNDRFRDRKNNTQWILLSAFYSGISLNFLEILNMHISEVFKSGLRNFHLNREYVRFHLSKIVRKHDSRITKTVNFLGRFLEAFR